MLGVRVQRGLNTALGTLAELERLAWVPQRATRPAETGPGDIQFDLDPFVDPPIVLDGVPVRFGPIHTVFATARLTRAPTADDRAALQEALAAIEQAYPWRPDGVFVHLAYGVPYFRRLAPGLRALHVPRLLADTSRFVLEEAQPAPTDVHPANPHVRKPMFHLPVRIERNDLLLTLRGDDPARLADVLGWLGGSGRLAGARVASPRLGLRFTTSRAMFVQMGLPRKLAAAHGLPFAGQLHPRAEAWLGPAEHHPPSPTATVTFAGGLLTTAEPGDYFDNGAIQHLSHDIVDLQHFFAGEDEAFTEQVRCAFQAPPAPAGRRAAAMHQPVQGPGFDAMDVPGGARQPKLQFSIFVPTSELCAAGRAREAELNLHYLTATRRQNFLVPPRRHRCYPLAEL